MAKEGDNSFGVASVVLGILSVLSFIVFPIALILGVISLVFGILQRKRSKNNWANSGIVLAIIGILLGSLIYYWITTLLNSPDFQSALQQAQELQQIAG